MSRAVPPVFSVRLLHERELRRVRSLSGLTLEHLGLAAEEESWGYPPGEEAGSFPMEQQQPPPPRPR
jgi:hypothetical protein